MLSSEPWFIPICTPRIAVALAHATPRCSTLHHASDAVPTSKCVYDLYDPCTQRLHLYFYGPHPQHDSQKWRIAMICIFSAFHLLGKFFLCTSQVRKSSLSLQCFGLTSIRHGVCFGGTPYLDFYSQPAILCKDYTPFALFLVGQWRRNDLSCAYSATGMYIHA